MILARMPFAYYAWNRLILLPWGTRRSERSVSREACCRGGSPTGSPARRGVFRLAPPRAPSKRYSREGKPYASVALPIFSFSLRFFASARRAPRLLFSSS